MSFLSLCRGLETGKLAIKKGKAYSEAYCHLDLETSANGLTLETFGLERLFETINIFLLLTEFAVRTVGYGPSFFPLGFISGKNEDP